MKRTFSRSALSPRLRRPRHFRRRERPSMLPPLAALTLLGLVLAVLLTVWPPAKGRAAAPPEEESAVPSEPPPSQDAGEENNNTGDIQVPDWITQDFIPVNEYSRPGDPVPQVNGAVVHYVGNPGTTAQQNRSYFANLAQTHETWASSHFVVGIDGAVIQCVPLDEIAYCSNNRNADTISIECCHPDDSGQFTPETVEALTQLLNWLIETYGLEREDILRHYDVSGKECPRYYVKNPDAWEELLDGLTFPE